MLCKQIESLGLTIYIDCVFDDIKHSLFALQLQQAKERPRQVWFLLSLYYHVRHFKRIFLTKSIR